MWTIQDWAQLLALSASPQLAPVLIHLRQASQQDSLAAICRQPEGEHGFATSEPTSRSDRLGPLKAFHGPQDFCSNGCDCHVAALAYMYKSQESYSLCGKGSAISNVPNSSEKVHALSIISAQYLSMSLSLDTANKPCLIRHNQGRETFPADAQFHGRFF